MNMLLRIRRAVEAASVKMLLMAVVVASAALSDEEFLETFSNLQLPPCSFRHGDHLRLAWIQLHTKPFEEALTLVREGIRRYAKHQGADRKFHETVTTAWVKLLATHPETSFAEFITNNEHRLNLALLYRFWTPAVLDSEAARTSWIPPDKEPLPV